MSDTSSWSSVSEGILNDKYPLHRACRDGEVTALVTLLQDIQSKDHMILEDKYYGWTPSHWAAYFGRLDCIMVLHGMNKHGFKTPTDLRTNRFNQTPTHIAAFAGHQQCVEWLLNNGAMADARDYLGETPLHKAARAGSTGCVELLAGHKSVIGLVNNNSQSAGQLADACSHNPLAQYLLRLEEQQARATTCTISRSIPGHGINAGLFPTQNSSVPKQVDPPKPTTSSNGYYGFQSINLTNGQTATLAQDTSEDCDMETDAIAPVINTSNGQTNGIVSNSSLDITLDPAVCQNQIPIGGRKRYREESPMPEMKRTRREGPETPMSIGNQGRRTSPLIASRKMEGAPILQPTNKFVCKSLPASKLCMGSLIEHSCSVGVEKVYETANIEMMMTQMHGC